MTETDLEQIRPWLDSEQRPTDAGYPAPYRLVNRGWLRRDFDNFYVLTNRGKNEAEALIGRPL
jgi:hypothetical protein